MTKHRFFVPPENIVDGHVSFPVELEAQLSRVLRFQTGDQVEVLDNQGNAFIVQLTQTHGKHWFGEILTYHSVNADPGIWLTLYFGLTKREKVEWILQKGTEVGVSSFQPYISRRTLAQQVDGAEKHLTRWKVILREASEQSGRGRVPEVYLPLKFPDALKTSTSASGLVLAAWEDEPDHHLKSALGVVRPASIGLFCGPEGGFDPAEIDLMRAAGVRFFSLGKRILRMETAAILAPALVLYELGEMTVSK